MTYTMKPAIVEGRFQVIQYLRAVAKVGVVFYHVYQGSLDGVADIGAHGVDLFFVISGFLMCLLSVGGETGRPLKRSKFALDRIARIVPP